MAKLHKKLIAVLQRVFYKQKLYHILNKVGLYRPRVITHIDGGLGSQMWQFALGYSVSQKVGLPLTLETNFYRKSGKDCNGVQNRNFLLFDTFPEVKKMYKNEVESTKSFMTFFVDNTERSTYEYTPSVLIPNRPIFLSQYYSNVKYVEEYKDELTHFFKFTPSMSDKENSLARQIANTNSCMVHIRKGDFLGLSVDVCSDKYYIEAILKMAVLEKNVEFYIFSNDETYFERNIQPHCSQCTFHIIKQRCEEDPRVDFYLMSQCKHAIISNSGFSWMAAWLNNNKSARIIMPDRWNNDKSRMESSKNAFYVQGWIKMPVD